MHKSHTLFLITGMPATGKTSFANQLAKEKAACLIDIDTASEPIIQAAMDKICGYPTDRDSPLFKSTFREPIYSALFALAAANLSHISVVLAGPFTKELSNPNWIDEIRNRLGPECEIRCIYLYCDEALRVQRLNRRGNPRDLPKLDAWESHVTYYDQSKSPSCPHIAIDTGSQQTENLIALLKKLA